MDDTTRAFIEATRRAIAAEGLEQKTLAVRLRVTPQHLNAVLRGRANLSRKIEEGLRLQLGVRLAEYGVAGEAVDTAGAGNVLASGPDTLSVTITGGAGGGDCGGFVPVALPGGLCSHIAFRRDWLACRASGPVFLARMEGDVMRPSIPDDSLVLVDGGQKAPAHNRIFHVRLHGEVCFRRLDVAQGRVLGVRTDSGEVVTVTDDELEILGRALWYCAEL